MENVLDVFLKCVLGMMAKFGVGVRILTQFMDVKSVFREVGFGGVSDPRCRQEVDDGNSCRITGSADSDSRDQWSNHWLDMRFHQQRVDAGGLMVREWGKVPGAIKSLVGVHV